MKNKTSIGIKIKIARLGIKLFFVRLPAWIKYPTKLILVFLYICFMSKIYAVFLAVFTPVFKEWTDFFIFLMAVTAVVMKPKR